MNERHKPLCVVDFYTEQGKLSARGTNIEQNKMDDDVVSVQTTRDMGADAPTFSIILSRRNRWDKFVRPNDLLEIKMSRPPERLTTVFVGLVDDCRKSISLQGDTPTRTVTVTGRGLNKALIVFDMGIVPEADFSTSIGWLVSKGITLAGATVDQVLRSVWDTIARPFINYKWSNSSSYFDKVATIFLSKPKMVLLDDSNLLNYQGSLWSFFKEVSEEPFYETFWEVIEDVPTFISRPTPFNKDTWSDLKTYDITDNNVVYEELGVSDLETYTLYSVGAKATFSDSDPYKTFGKFPLWYPPYFDKYGIRRLHKESAYLAVAEATDASSPELMQTLQEDLFNWNIKNNSFLNGILILKGEARYTIGSKLKYTSIEDGTEYVFYITSVSHNFVNFGSYTTQLSVTRGCEESTRFDSPVGSFEEYIGCGLSDYSGGTTEAETKRLQFLSTQLGQSIAISASGGIVNGTHPSQVYVEPGQSPSSEALSCAELAIDIKNNGVNGRKITYLFGGTGIESGYADCTQFTSYVYQKISGKYIGRTSGAQVLQGQPVKKEDLIPGDLLIFKDTYNSSHIYGASHAGIYIGNNKFIHLSGDDYKGTVQEGDLTSAYYTKHWLMGRRIL